MVNLTFLLEAWEDYLYWQGQDKKTLKKINALIKVCVIIIMVQENQNL